MCTHTQTNKQTNKLTNKQPLTLNAYTISVPSWVKKKFLLRIIRKRFWNNIPFVPIISQQSFLTQVWRLSFTVEPFVQGLSEPLKSCTVVTYLSRGVATCPDLSRRVSRRVPTCPDVFRTVVTYVSRGVAAWSVTWRKVSDAYKIAVAKAANIDSLLLQRWCLHY